MISTGGGFRPPRLLRPEGLGIVVVAVDGGGRGC